MPSITVEQVLTPQGMQKHQRIDIENGYISKIGPAAENETHFQVHTLLPGYVDTQVNGGGGVLFNQAPCEDALNTMAEAHLRYGSTSMLPTIITDNAATMAQAAQAVANVIAQQHSTIKGIHFEGPFLSTAKKGVHDASFIRTPSDKEIATLCRNDIGKVLLTVAPETVSPDFIKEISQEGVIVAIGHTNASFEQVNKALQAGATGFTHLYNAMSAFTSREPGAVGAALMNSAAYSGLIVDHHHVHPQSALFAINTKGAHRIMLVTDAMAHVGSDITRLPFFDTEIIRQGDKLTTPEGTLAGSCLDMHSALVNTCRDLNVTLAKASEMASLTPARFVGLDDEIGVIASGYRANFVALDETLNLCNVWVNGELIARG